MTRPTLHDAYEHLLEPYSVPCDPKDPEDLLIKLATTQAYNDMPRAGQVHVAFAWSWDRDLNMPFGPGEERWTAQKIRAQASFLPEAERRRMVEGLALALSGGGFGEAAGLVRAFRPRVIEIESALAKIERGLLEVGATRVPTFAPMRSAALGALTFVLAASGCEPRAQEPAEHAASSHLQPDGQAPCLLLPSGHHACRQAGC